MGRLSDALRKQSEVLKAELVESSGLPHAGLVGGRREDAVRDALKKYLPGDVVVQTGLIENTRGDVSRQQDCIVVDRRDFFPLLYGEPGASVVVPIESVVATIEVKSNTRKSTLTTAIENVESVKRLVGSDVEYSPFGGILCMTGAEQLSTSARLFHEAGLDTHPRNRRCDALIVLGKGVVFWGEAGDGDQLVMMSPHETEEVVEVEMPDALWIFLVAMHHHLARMSHRPPDFLAYLGTDTDLIYRTRRAGSPSVAQPLSR